MPNDPHQHNLPYITRWNHMKKVTGILGETKARELERTDPDFPRRIRLNDRQTGVVTTELFAYLEKFRADPH